jgi:hypothetical protein
MEGVNDMSHRRGLLRIAAATLAAATAFGASVGAADGATHHTHHLRKLSAPAQKFYGVYISSAPASMAPVQKVAQETGKSPNVSLFYNAWGSAATAGYSNINFTAITNACSAGMLPMLTWESWDTANGAPYSQPAFAPSVIASGKYDAYIRAVADKLKTAPCPVALRLDQEVNSYWYPWGINTHGMNNSAADYVAMWQHVWNIFNAENVKNVEWVWSPNAQSAKHTGLPDLSASYPGAKYVDMVGVDGYLMNSTDTFHSRFQPTLTDLKTFAADKPWIIAECGVSSKANKPAQIKNLLTAVAHRKRLVGMNYFDTNKAQGNYLLDETSASLDAFKSGIANPVYASGVAGNPPGA